MISVIDAVAHVINFTLLIAITVYVFKTYLISIFRQKIVAESVHRATMAKRLELLKKQNKSLFLAGEHQKRLYEDLGRKFEIWKQSVAVHTQQQKQEFQQNTHAVKVRFERLCQHQAQVQERAQVVPVALAQAQQDLERCFHNQQQVRAYAERVVDHMRKVR